MSDDEDFGFEYSDDDQEEDEVDVENQYYNSKGLLETDEDDALKGFEEVVSMEEVPMMFGSCSFQSNDVSGAQNSVFLLLFSSASKRTDLLSITFHKRR